MLVVVESYVLHISLKKQRCPMPCNSRGDQPAYMLAPKVAAACQAQIVSIVPKSFPPTFSIFGRRLFFFSLFFFLSFFRAGTREGLTRDRSINTWFIRNETR